MPRTSKKEVSNIPWIYGGIDIDEAIERGLCLDNYYGFIYMISDLATDRIYIGKKILKTYKTNISKVLNPKTGRMNTVREKIYFDSNWRDYYGSSKELLKEIRERGYQDFVREILYFVPSKKLLTYYEMKEQILREVIEPGCKSYNDNILGKFFPSDFEHLIENK